MRTIDLLRKTPFYSLAKRAYRSCWPYEPELSDDDLCPAILKLIKDKPPLHFLTEEVSRQVSELSGIAAFSPGQTTWAVPAAVLRYFAEIVPPGARTIETGSGHSTIALAALGSHHTCVTPDVKSVELIRAFLPKVGIPEGRITFHLEPSDVCLPKLPADDSYDFAFIDGCHGYPLPMIDWHYIDLRLKVGGIIGFDNTEIPAVNAHCDFMVRNGTYSFVHELLSASSNYGVTFFRKLKDQDRWDLLQQFSRRRVTRRGFRDSLKTTISEWTGKRWGEWPWS